MVSFGRPLTWPEKEKAALRFTLDHAQDLTDKSGAALPRHGIAHRSGALRGLILAVDDILCSTSRPPGPSPAWCGMVRSEARGAGPVPCHWSRVSGRWQGLAGNAQMMRAARG